MTGPMAGDDSRPVAILHADVEDYTGRMDRDPKGTIRAMKDCRALMAVLVDEYAGRLMREQGDSLLAEFPGVPNAVKCAVIVQEKLHTLAAALPEGQALRLRIGVHKGRVYDDETTIYGSDVNIACRIQEQADAGGICISKAAFEEVGPLSGVRFEDLGLKQMKHVNGPLHLYRVCRSTDPDQMDSAPRELPRLTLPKIPSVVVLPFQNHSGDLTKDYLSDGITEDVITDLSRFRDLFVIGRASAFAYKYRAVDTTQIGRELGVRYVLEGSVMMGRDRIRLSVRLVDAANSQVVWAERYNRESLDLFEVQEDLSRQVVGAMSGVVERWEQSRMLEKGTDNLAAYDLVLRGQQEFYGYNKDANHRARALYEEAIRVDPSYARAHACLSRTHNYDWRYRWSKDATHSAELSLELAKQAIRLDESDARGHAELGWVLLYRKELAASIGAYEMALRLNPNNADVMAMMADAVSYAGDPARAVEMVNRAKRLNPHFPDSYLWAEADALFALRRYEAVVDCVGQMRNPTEGYRLLAASYAYLGLLDEARRAAEEVMRRQPDFSVDYWISIQPEADPAELEHFRQGLLKAGLK